MKKNYWKRVIAFLLVFVMVVQTMSLDAYAAMKTETAPDETVETETSEEAEEQQPAEIVGEMEEFRSEREKHFRLSDGSFIAVSYDYPVHYQEADGSWKEIDNTLFEEPDENGETVYKSGNTEVSVEFSGTLEEGELFTSSTDGHSVNMHLLDR